MSKQRPVRVLMVAPSQGHYGGLEAWVLALAESMTKRAEFAPRLCFKLVQGATFDAELRTRCEKLGLPLVVVNRASQALLNNLRWADVIHAQNPSPDVAFGAHLAGRPLVMTIINHRAKQNTLHTRMWGLAARLAHRRCYISDFVRKTWEPHGLRRHSQVFPAVSSLPPAAKPVWDRAGFFFIGRWIANKGLEKLVEAYATAKIDRTRWPLTLAGDGPLRPTVEKLLAQYDLKAVKLPGFVSDEEKFAMLAHAKWNVAAPNTREDLGLTPIEARHLAVPSIISRDGGLPEAAGPQALVAEPGDAASLRIQLEKAATMNEDEYRQRALDGQADLARFLRPLTDYHAIYHELAWWCY